jgi:hypothetical protein
VVGVAVPGAVAASWSFVFVIVVFVVSFVSHGEIPL